MFFKKSDIIIVIFIISISIIILFAYRNVYSNRPAKAEIYYYSELVDTIELTKGVERTFSIPQNKNVVFHLAKDGYISFKESDCPDKVCINCGRLKMVGESAACLPNNIILKIVSDNNHMRNFDIIVGSQR